MTKYSLASSTWDDFEIEAINKVVGSGMFTMGKYVQQFEENFANYVGSRYCVMVNSGSSANLLATAALFYRRENKLKPGDEVIVPAVSWPTTYYPLYQYGLKLKFVDIDHLTLNYNLKSLKDAVTEQTRMIMVVNLLGNPNNFDEIQKIIGEKNIILIEDNCESLGATFGSKQAGTFGEMGTFSSFFSHHISTMEGGMVVTEDEELYHILLSLRAHGWTRNLPKQNYVCGTKSDNPFEESFRFVLPGYNVRPIEMSGAIGLEQLKKLPEFIEQRRENARLFKDLFQENPCFYIQQEVGNSSWFGFSLILKEDVPFTRSDVIRTLQENEIDCRPIVAGNFAKNEVVKYFDYEIHSELKNAEYIDKNGFFVGNHQFNIHNEIRFLHNLLRNLQS
ncbi:DegT/DnrJ/EryC1/StrS family aminotransferase [Paenibacillus aurantius]|uniref:DegT/DnrJ/EryC1/StrS family aminotransferase n=1 Tax=Paenibacillus aurantius TaxID=2918900 RepID=A0AA96LE49_9BACL|nr:DegT/DnrJ/EryC1/StrS family aminotransferase [Paenibacillus aurantius]WNQ10426.1 DegT/DnrJ/EryC1/StrS family aminotransferase [Paenibacillus aurantius]